MCPQWALCLVILVIVVFFFKNKQIYSLFPILKMAANYAEICKVGKLEAGFQQVPFGQIFRNFHNIVVKYQQLKISKEK